jgi:hypothetical protein
MHPSVKRKGDASSAGNRRSSQDLDYWAIRDRKRRQKSQEPYPVLAGIVGAAKRFHERLRQDGDLDNRHETTARDFPERCTRNMVAPEGLPSSNGRSVGAEQPRKLAHSARCRSLPHGTDQEGRPHTRGDDNWRQFSFSWDRAGNGKDTPCFLGSNPPLQFNSALVSCQWSVAGFSGPERIYRVFLVAPVKAFRDDHGLRGSMSVRAIQSYQGRVPPLAMDLHPVGVNPMAAR